MAYESDTQSRVTSNYYRTRRLRFHRSTRVFYAGVDSAIERILDSKEIHNLHDFCRPLQPPFLCAPTTIHISRGHIASKESFRGSHYISQSYYHADNGRFIERAFREHCKEKQQMISFSGVNAHFQNALAEKRIRDLQDSARTMLVHAKHRWP
jgi:hypothetical protein